MRYIIIISSLLFILCSCVSSHIIVDPIETRYKFDCIPITVSDSLNEFKGGTRAIVAYKIYLAEVYGDSLKMKVDSVIPSAVIIYDDNNKSIIESVYNNHKPMPKFVQQVMAIIKQCDVTIEHYNELLSLKQIMYSFTVRKVVE